ncbi:major facilitator protein [Pilatotrama ljubarskyi]|nr:major facilitator protein [Pilatotrama ljubarskyi]
MDTSAGQEVIDTASISKETRESSVYAEAGGYRALYPDVNEAKLVRRIDLRVVPMISILYLLAFLDRVNVSNAVLFSLKQDLNLTGNQFNTAIVVFFIPYVLFEIPSNILLKRFKPHVWSYVSDDRDTLPPVPLCMLVFGTITVLQAFAQNFGGLVAARFFLGLAESGFFPGCFYMLSMWYRRDEAQKRYSFFFSSTSLAGGFGGLLASAIGKLDGVRGYHGWRWIFILEGLLTIVVAVIAFFILPDFPEEARWLKTDEREFSKARLYEDVGYSRIHDPLTFKAGLAVLKDFKMFFGPLMYLGFIVPAYSYTYFAPTIVQTFGHSVIRTQLLSVPPWACTFVFTMIIATISDYTRRRFVFLILCASIGVAGMIILLVVHDNSKLQYGALYIVPMGALSAMPIALCWFETNREYSAFALGMERALAHWGTVGTHHRRAVGTATQIGFGNIGGIIAAYSFLAKDSPKFIPGYSICLAFTLLAMLAACGYYLAVLAENRRRDRAEAENADTLSADEKARLGDLSPDYRYYT